MSRAFDVTYRTCLSAFAIVCACLHVALCECASQSRTISPETCSGEVFDLLGRYIRLNNLELQQNPMTRRRSPARGGRPVYSIGRFTVTVYARVVRRAAFWNCARICETLGDI